MPGSFSGYQTTPVCTGGHSLTKRAVHLQKARFANLRPPYWTVSTPWDSVHDITNGTDDMAQRLLRTCLTSHQECEHCPASGYTRSEWLVVTTQVSQGTSPEDTLGDVVLGLLQTQKTHVDWIGEPLWLLQSPWFCPSYWTVDCGSRSQQVRNGGKNYKNKF